jgi:hypothetical protein
MEASARDAAARTALAGMSRLWWFGLISGIAMIKAFQIRAMRELA